MNLIFFKKCYFDILLGPSKSFFDEIIKGSKISGGRPFKDNFCLIYLKKWSLKKKIHMSYLLWGRRGGEAGKNSLALWLGRLSLDQPAWGSNPRASLT